MFALLVVPFAVPLVAQPPVRLAQEAPLLKEPAGVRLGTLAAGARVTPGRVSGELLEVSVSGWIFTTSTKPDRREGLDLSVTAAGGENLRDAPDGNVIARMVEGALFRRVAARGGWTMVRRSGWIPRAALPQRPPPAAPPPASKPAPRPARDSAAAAPRLPQEPPPAREGTLRRGAAIERVPDGAALATASTPAPVTILESDHDWVRVRLEGWVRTSDVDGTVTPPPAITARMLREAPEKYVGQTVEWRVQFLARQQADELRPEMPLGHPYLLVRGPLPEAGFAYVMVTKEQAVQFEGTKPLDELTLTVTVRAARTRYLATPVVELVKVGGGT